MTDQTTCTWTEDDDGNFETTCGEMFVLITGTPYENSMRFCCYCGSPLVEVSGAAVSGVDDPVTQEPRA